MLTSVPFLLFFALLLIDPSWAQCSCTGCYAGSSLLSTYYIYSTCYTCTSSSCYSLRASATFCPTFAASGSCDSLYYYGYYYGYYSSGSTIGGAITGAVFFVGLVIFIIFYYRYRQRRLMMVSNGAVAVSTVAVAPASPYGQPMMAPAYGQPGMVQPAYGQPGMIQPGIVQPYGQTGVVMQPAY